MLGQQSPPCWLGPSSSPGGGRPDPALRVGKLTARAGSEVVLSTFGVDSVFLLVL